MLESNPQIVLFTGFTSFGFGRNAGPYKIASELRNNGFSVQVIEYFNKWSMEELKIILKKFVTQDTLWVGISTTFLCSPYNIVPYGGQHEIVKDGAGNSAILNNY
jgi:hypothetical protein